MIRMTSYMLLFYIFCKASTAWHICLPLSLRFPTLEHCATGGESLLPEEYEQWKQRTGLSIHEVYGQSETVGVQAPSAPLLWAQLQSTTSEPTWPSVCWCLLCAQYHWKPMGWGGFGVQRQVIPNLQKENIQFINSLRDSSAETVRQNVKRHYTWHC